MDRGLPPPPPRRASLFAPARTPVPSPAQWFAGLLTVRAGLVGAIRSNWVDASRGVFPSLCRDGSAPLHGIPGHSHATSAEPTGGRGRSVPGLLPCAGKYGRRREIGLRSSQLGPPIRLTRRSLRDPRPYPRRGNGEVYKARDSKLDRDVAIMSCPSPFQRIPSAQIPTRGERRRSAVNHQNILTICDVGTEDAFPLLVSELLESNAPVGPCP